MVENKQAPAELLALRDSLQASIDSLQTELKTLRDRYQAVQTTLELLGHRSRFVVQVNGVAEQVPVFNGLTQAQALVRIARENNGRFKMRDAKRLLLGAGLIKTAKNANNIIYNVIQREEGKFRRVAPGEYELVTKEERPLLAGAAHK